MSVNPNANNSTGIPVLDPTASGSVITIGSNLPHVDPNNYSGNIHFGPSTTITGPFPPNMQLPNATFHPQT